MISAKLSDLESLQARFRNAVKNCNCEARFYCKFEI